MNNLLLEIPGEETKSVKIRRSHDNTRKRPNGVDRHDIMNVAMQNELHKSFINPTDLEWMSLNYRKERAAKVSPSRRRMILVMF